MGVEAISAVLETGKRERAKAQNRDAILEAARQVFAELGYETTSVRDIIRRTDLASGTFYNYFKSKEEVYHALHDDGIQRFRPMLRAARDGAKDFEAFVRAAYLAYFRYCATDGAPRFVRMQDPAWTQVRFDTPETRALFDELKTYLVDFLASEGLGAVDPDYFTAGCMGVAERLAERMMARSDTGPEDAADFATAYTMGGLKGVST
jgi:AcrR family transcriptional regulator